MTRSGLSLYLSRKRSTSAVRTSIDPPDADIRFKVARRCRIGFHGHHALESPRKRNREKSHAREEIESQASAFLAFGHFPRKLVDEKPIHLKKGKVSDAIFRTRALRIRGIRGRTAPCARGSDQKTAGFRSRARCRGSFRQVRPRGRGSPRTSRSEAVSNRPHQKTPQSPAACAEKLPPPGPRAMRGASSAAAETKWRNLRRRKVPSSLRGSSRFRALRSVLCGAVGFRMPHSPALRPRLRF